MRWGATSCCGSAEDGRHAVASAAHVIEAVGGIGVDLADPVERPTGPRDGLTDLAVRVLDACPVRTGVSPERLARDRRLRRPRRAAGAAGPRAGRPRPVDRHRLAAGAAAEEASGGGDLRLNDCWDYRRARTPRRHLPLDHPDLADGQAGPATLHVTELRRRGGEPLGRSGPPAGISPRSTSAPEARRADQVGQRLGAPDRRGAFALESVRSLGRVRRPTAGQMGHAPPHDSVGDASPDAVTDTQVLLDDGVHEVMGEVDAPAGAAHGEHDPVVPLDERLDRTAVSHPAERELHTDQVWETVNRVPGGCGRGRVRRGGLTGPGVVAHGSRVAAGTADVRAALPPALAEALAGYEEHLRAQRDLSAHTAAGLRHRRRPAAGPPRPGGAVSRSTTWTCPRCAAGSPRGAPAATAGPRRPATRRPPGRSPAGCAAPA